MVDVAKAVADGAVVHVSEGVHVPVAEVCVAAAVRSVETLADAVIVLLRLVVPRKTEAWAAQDAKCVGYQVGCRGGRCIGRGGGGRGTCQGFVPSIARGAVVPMPQSLYVDSDLYCSFCEKKLMPFIQQYSTVVWFCWVLPILCFCIEFYCLWQGTLKSGE